MSDRELIELAAKAAGICLHPDDKLRRTYGNWGCDTTCTACKKDPADARWNPLTDDGDLYRLARKLDIRIHFGLSYVTFMSNGVARFLRWPEDGANDVNAIVSCAAEIGRGMP